MNANVELIEKDGGIVELRISSEDHGGVHNTTSLFYELDLEERIVKGPASFCVSFDVFFFLFLIFLISLSNCFVYAGEYKLNP